MCKDIGNLYSWTGEDGNLKVCGLNECKGSWVEVGLLVLVCLGQWRGWRWDMGLVDKWVEGIVVQATKTEEAKRMRAMGGDVEQGVVQEEKQEAVVEDVVGVDMEKQALLVDIEEREFEKA